MSNEVQVIPHRAGTLACELGDFRFDITRRELRLGEEQIPLGRQQFDFLALLVEEPRGAVVPYERLQSRVWHGEHVAPGAIAQAALVLRRVLRRSVSRPLRLVTVRGVGFRLEGAVQRLHEAAATGSQGLLRVLLLPVANAVGPSVEFGLPGVAQLLAAGLRVPGRLEPMLATGMATPPTAPADERAAQRVLRLHLGQQGDWMVLEAVALPPGRAPQAPLFAESVLGVELLDMTRRLVRQLQRALLGEAAPEFDTPFPWRDDWANLTYARAAAFMVQQDYRNALPLLQALDRCAPRHPLGTLALLRALAVESPAEVPERAKALLRTPGLASDALALAHALVALARGESTESEAEPGANLQAALHHLSRSNVSDLTLRTLRVLTLLEWRHFERQGCPADGVDPLLARYRRMVDDARVLGQPDSEAVGLSGIGSLQITAGDLPGARHSLMQAVRIFSAVSTPVTAALEHALLGLIDGSLGDMPGAVQQALAGLRALDSQSPQARRVLVASDAALLLFDIGHAGLAAGLQTVLAAWRNVPGFEAHPALLAAKAALLHDQGASQAALDTILELLASPEPPYGKIIFLRQWGQASLRLGMAVGREGEVRARLEHLPDWPALTRCPEFLRTVNHAEAVGEWRAGRAAVARQRLLDIAGPPGTGPASRARCLAILDLAWIALQEQDTGVAGRWMTALGPCFDRHPLGLAARAHRQRRLGHLAEAEALIDAAHALWGRGRAAWWAGPQPGGPLLSTCLLPLG